MSNYIPFNYLRGSSAARSSKAPKSLVANQTIINDRSIQIYTSLVAAGVYAVVIYGSFYTWLPVFLIVHFDGLKDLSAAHSAALPYLIASFIPVGIAAKVFLFTPAEGAKHDAFDAEIASFDPESATLQETIIYNAWGYSKNTRTLITRTAVLASISWLHTATKIYTSVAGADFVGAAGWSAIWAAAAIATGTAFAWVGDA